MGSQINIPFSGERYDSVYECMRTLMDQVDGNVYHRRKFERLLKSIAKDGRLVIKYLCLLILIDSECRMQFSTKRGRNLPHPFKVRLD